MDSEPITIDGQILIRVSFGVSFKFDREVHQEPYTCLVEGYNTLMEGEIWSHNGVQFDDLKLGTRP